MISTQTITGEKQQYNTHCINNSNSSINYNITNEYQEKSSYLVSYQDELKKSQSEINISFSQKNCSDLMKNTSLGSKLPITPIVCTNEEKQNKKLSSYPVTIISSRDAISYKSLQQIVENTDSYFDDWNINLSVRNQIWLAKNHELVSTNMFITSLKCTEFLELVSEHTLFIIYFGKPLTKRSRQSNDSTSEKKLPIRLNVDAISYIVDPATQVTKHVLRINTFCFQVKDFILIDLITNINKFISESNCNFIKNENSPSIESNDNTECVELSIQNKSSSSNKPNLLVNQVKVPKFKAFTDQYVSDLFISSLKPNDKFNLISDITDYLSSAGSIYFSTKSVLLSLHIISGSYYYTIFINQSYLELISNLLNI